MQRCVSDARRKFTSFRIQDSRVRTLVADEHDAPLHRELVVRQKEASLEHFLVRQEALEAEEKPNRHHHHRVVGLHHVFILREGVRKSGGHRQTK